MVDIPDNSTTTAAIAVGTSFYDTLEVNGDHDWIAVNLVAGTQYEFRLHGMGVDELEDPLLTLLNSSGTSVASNDDVPTIVSGGGIGPNTVWDGAGQGESYWIDNANQTDPRLLYTATTTGTYYLDVSGHNNAFSGDYILTAVQAQTSSNLMVFTIDEIAWQLTNNFAAAFDEEPAAFIVGGDNTLTVDIDALDADEQYLARQALVTWSNVTGIAFSEVSSGAEITFHNVDTFYGYDDTAYTLTNFSNGVISHADVVITEAWVDFYGATLNSYSFETYVHEIGHALGLGHSGNYNGGADYPSDTFYRNDSGAYSIMSYMGDDNTYVGATFDVMLTPQMADIIAIQYLYGDVGDHLTGDNTYGFGSNTGIAAIDGAVNAGADMAMTIYDEGGNDTLNFSNSRATQILNLNAESFSSVLGGSLNLAIARGVQIENAMGGSGNDTIYGNGVVNYLYGNAGNDTFTGAAGNDYLSGGSGTDYAVYTGAQSQYSITLTSVTDLRLGSADGSDTIDSVEYLIFTDGTLAVTDLYANLVYYYAVNTSGDYYYGYFYDSDSYSYGYQTSTVSESGFWYYYVYAFYLDYALAANNGYNYITDYYDYESGTWSVPYYYDNYGYSGWDPNNPISAGVEYAIIGGGYSYFDSYYEADGTNLYYYWAENSSGDYYYGYFYDDDQYAYGYQAPTVSESGSWNYYVYAIYSGYAAESLTGYNYVTDYYDSESGTWSAPYYYDLGGSSGWDPDSPITSAVEWVVINGGYSYFDSYWEADGSNLIYYYAENSSGDFYYGYFYDDDEYSYGYQLSTPSESGTWDYYVYAIYEGYGPPDLTGYNYVTDYYDYESGTWSVPYYNSIGGYSGWDPGSPITSGVEYAVVNGGYSYFDSYYEADGSNLIYYYAQNSSGDYYYGYFYDDDEYSYGYQGSTASETGFWEYYVYAIYGGYGPPAQTGYNYVTDYYDYESGTWSVPYYYDLGGYSGWDPGSPITSATDWAFINGGYAYFDSYWEAN